MRKQAGQYIPSQCYPEIEPGNWFKGALSEDLERMTFGDESTDLHITRDVTVNIDSLDYGIRAEFNEVLITTKP